MKRVEMPVPHGWRLERNAGRYGAYGWGLGIFFSKTPTVESYNREQFLVLRFGPWAIEWTRCLSQENILAQRRHREKASSLFQDHT